MDSGLSLKVMEITMRLDIGNDPFGNPMKRDWRTEPGELGESIGRILEWKDGVSQHH